MERLKKSHERLLKAYKTLDKILIKFDKIQKDNSEEDIIAYRDSIIKRFEYSYDLTWKYLKLFFKEKHGLDILSPKKVFQECLKHKIIDEEESRILLYMVDDRNLTTHTYNEDTAENVSSRVPQYYQLFIKLAEKTKP